MNDIEVVLCLKSERWIQNAKKYYFLFEKKKKAQTYCIKNRI